MEWQRNVTLCELGRLFITERENEETQIERLEISFNGKTWMIEALNRSQGHTNHTTGALFDVFGRIAEPQD